MALPRRARSTVWGMIALMALGLSAPLQAEERSCAVSHVRDGDTVECRDGSVIRLQGIDTPELDQSHGQTAGRVLRERILGEHIRVETHGRGSYGRLIGTLHQDGTNLNAWLVRRGHAWAYDRYLPEDSRYPALERQARQAEKGLWSRPDPIPPWDWR